MRTFRFVVASIVALLCLGQVEAMAYGAAEPKISVFANFVRAVAKERGVTLAQAADMLYALGVRGIDANPRDTDLDELAATKLRIVNFYFFPNMYAADNGAADAKFCLDQAERYGVPQVMVVPTDFTEGGDQAAEMEKDVAGMRLFANEAKKRGITTTVEDFGLNANPGSYMKYLKRFLDEIPELGYALDSGNLHYAGRGESILDMMEYAKGRIAHVHLKDLTREDNRRFATLGLGAVPNEKVVKTVAASGYNGWYTLENTVGDTYLDTVRQTAVLKTWLREAASR